MKRNHFLKAPSMPKLLPRPFSPRQAPTFRSKARNSIRAYFFLCPSLLGVVLFVLIPFLDVIRRSFYDAMGKTMVFFENYTLILQNNAFHQAVLNTVRFFMTCIPLLLLLSLFIALLLQGSFGYQEKFRTIFLAPLAIPVASVVLLWKLFFDDAGYLNQLLSTFHFSTVDWMNENSAFYVLVFSYLWKNTGYDMILWLAGLNGISFSLYEAAKVDGANSLTCFWYITLPNLKPTIFMITCLSFINSFKVFREAYLVAGDYPHTSIYLVQHLFNNWFVRLDIHKMSAAAVMTSAVIFIFLLLIQKMNGKDEES